MWTYSQGTGVLTDPNGQKVATGYSGHGHGRNNCELQHVRGVGPIPQGLWIIGKPRNSVNVGPFAMDLTPVPLTETFGRSAFMIHGDNGDKVLDESRGCIIFPRRVRHIIWDSGERKLKVVP
jgi:hypothetical protein